MWRTIIIPFTANCFNQFYLLTTTTAKNVLLSAQSSQMNFKASAANYSHINSNSNQFTTLMLVNSSAFVFPLFIDIFRALAFVLLLAAEHTIHHKCEIRHKCEQQVPNYSRKQEQCNVDGFRGNSRDLVVYFLFKSSNNPREKYSHWQTSWLFWLKYNFGWWLYEKHHEKHPLT